MGYLSRAKNYIETKARPLSREHWRSGVVSLEEEGSINRVTDTDRLFELLRKSPEVISLQQAMVDDIIGNGYHFEYLGESNGERARKQAREFYEKHVKEAFADAVMDSLTAGDGYLYLNMITQSEQRAYIYNKYKDRFNYETNAAALTKELEKEMKATKPKDVQMVPASTVEHDINKYGDITRFVQETQGRETKMNAEKVIHLGYLNLNGGTYNFSPMRSVVSELQILANAKDHNGKVFDNAAIVNKHFNLPNDGPNSQRYKHIKKTVQTFRNLENKHRDLITTGDVEVEDLNDIGDSMQFRELAEYITKVLVMAWGVPPTRIGMDISGDSGARQTSLTHSGYFKRIKRLQDRFLTPLNKGLWEKHFNVKMKLDDPDVQTEIKEADRDLRQTDVALKRLASGMWDRQKAASYLNISPEEMADLEDEQDKAIMELAANLNTGRDQQLSELEAFGDRADEEMQEDQQEVQDGEDS